MPKQRDKSHVTGQSVPAALAGALELAIGLAVPAAVGAGEATGGDTAVTIYSSALPGAVPAEFYRPMPGQGVPPAGAVPGFAMVRQERQVPLAAGRGPVRFADVAALIDPTTVTFTSLTDPGARVLEQNFQFDLVGTDKLLQRYIDRPLTVERSGAGGTVSAASGTLLSASDGLVLRGADGTLTALRDWQALRFGELPGGLITRPTLLWDIDAQRGGDHRVRVTYQTGGITWWADYNLLFTEGRDANNGYVDLSAWVSIINQSGASFPGARLKLIAGDVNRAPQARPPGVMMAMAREAVADDAGFAQQSFDEFHLYTLGRRTDLANNSTKQIELFEEARRVPAQRQLVFGSGTGVLGRVAAWTAPDFPGAGGRVETWLEFRNDKASGLGMPLPAGRVRVSRVDPADSSLEFIGEDVIGHTPRDERVRVRLGSAFDVVGERRQVDFASDERARWMEEEIEVTLRNRKDDAVDVQVRETLYRWSGWRILSNSQPFEKQDANTIVFGAKVPAGGEAKVRYRVRYSW
jgi:hypothetical protein